MVRMSISDVYSSRSRDGGYALRSKGVLPPRDQSPKTQKSSHGGKLSLGKVSLSKKKPKAMKSEEDMEDIYFRHGGKLSLGKVSLSKKKPKAMKSEEDMEDIYFRKSPKIKQTSLYFTTAALSYLHKQGFNLELVKLGLFEGGTIENGAMMHLNFKAKVVDDRSSPVETFFAQLRVFGGGDAGLRDLTVECCVSLGESKFLPEKRDNRGCLFCSQFVHHPIGGCKGIGLGWRTYESSEEEQSSEEESESEDDESEK